jgi:transcriptional regulator of met regulon
MKHMKDNRDDPGTPGAVRSAHRKVTVTVPQDLYERFTHESARRKIAGAPNQMISALFREALIQHLETPR